MSSLNKYFKYADDAYLIVPGSNASSIPIELDHHTSWAAKSNLKLNPSKTSEIVFSRRNYPNPPLNHGIQRHDNLKVLGVLVDNELSFDQHVRQTIKSCMQTLFALKIMKSFGLTPAILQTIFKSLVIISKLLYASPSWWGFISAQNKDMLVAFLNKAIRFGYYKVNDPGLYELQNNIERKLFQNIASNPAQ